MDCFFTSLETRERVTVLEWAVFSQAWKRESELQSLNGLFFHELGNARAC